MVKNASFNMDLADKQEEADRMRLDLPGLYFFVPADLQRLQNNIIHAEYIFSSSQSLQGR